MEWTASRKRKAKKGEDGSLFFSQLDRSEIAFSSLSNVLAPFELSLRLWISVKMVLLNSGIVKGALENRPIW